MYSARPRALQAGDTVALVNPAGPVLQENVQHGIDILKSWGLKVQVYGAFERHDGYLAGTDEHRGQQFQQALESDAAAIICSRGGYGAMRILDQLDFSVLLQSPKLVVGYSDITALHLAMATLNIPSLHAPALKNFATQPDHVETLKQALFGLRDFSSLNHQVNPVVDGSARGKVLGGNLSLVGAMLGNKYCPDLSDSILLLEDIGEPDFRLDRLFTSLRLADKGRPAGIILGDFTNCGGVYVDDSGIPEFVEKLASQFDIPVVSGFPSGHGSRNTSVPMGIMTEIDGSTGRVTFLEDTVRP